MLKGCVCHDLLDDINNYAWYNVNFSFYPPGGFVFENVIENKKLLKKFNNR